MRDGVIYTMTKIQTKRLVLKTNCTVVNGQLVFPEKNITSLLDTKSACVEDGGFAIYLKTGDYIGHIGILFHRKPYELTIGIDNEQFRHCGYMTEAQDAVIQWIFENCNTNQITALIGSITPVASRKLCKRNGFHEAKEGHDEWWILNKEDFKK